VGSSVRQSGSQASHWAGVSASGHDLNSRHPTSCVDDGAGDGDGEDADEGEVEEECVIE
jgi:hypothetical protein